MTLSPIRQLLDALTLARPRSWMATIHYSGGRMSAADDDDAPKRLERVRAASLKPLLDVG
jgi:hypothetical protein